MGKADSEELNEGVIRDAVEAVFADAILNMGAPAENGEEQAVQVVSGGGVGKAQFAEQARQGDVC